MRCCRKLFCQWDPGGNQIITAFRAVFRKKPKEWTASDVQWCPLEEPFFWTDTISLKGGSDGKKLLRYS